MSSYDHINSKPALNQPQTFTIEARKLEHARPPTPNQRKKENHHKSSQAPLQLFGAYCKPYSSIIYRSWSTRVQNWGVLSFLDPPKHKDLTVSFEGPIFGVDQKSWLVGSSCFYSILYHTIIYTILKLL